MADARTPLRKRFESERRRAAFIGSLPAGMTGIIAADTWLAPVLGIAGGLAAGLLAYGVIFWYETLMWRKRHGR